MFSGIIETKQSVLSTRIEGKCKRVRIGKPRSWKLALGESVSIDGICSTVVAKSAAHFDVEYMPETLGKTTAALFDTKRVINLERSLKYGKRVHGHFVMGHIDARVKVLAIKKEGRSRLITLSLPHELATFVVPRGSVAVNGVSLTVARKNRGALTMALIPHTLAATNLGALKKGDIVNMECDTMARYGRLKLHAAKRNRQKRAAL